MKRLPKQFKQEIIQMVENQKLTPLQIAEKLSLNKNAVQTMLSKLNYTFKKQNTPQFFKKEIDLLLKESKTPYQIAKILDLNPLSVSTHCFKLGYKFRPNQGNVRYFEKIDSHLKAYFLGFICVMCQ